MNQKQEGYAMNRPTFYALILFDPAGKEVFGGAFESRELAGAKGKASGKKFVVRAAML